MVIQFFGIYTILSLLWIIYIYAIIKNSHYSEDSYNCIIGELEGLTMTLKQWKNRIILITGNKEDAKVIQNMTTHEFLAYCKNMHDLVIEHI